MDPSRQAVGPEQDPFSSGFDFLLLNSDIGLGLFGEVIKAVSQGKQNSKLVMIVVTHGGLANEAYRTARYLQSVYDEIVGYVPSLCKSAGTLLIAAANRVIISAFGEIGPLDVQLVQKDELLGRRSGLITRYALEEMQNHSLSLFEHFMLNIIGSSGGAVTFRTASDLSTKVTSALMSKVYEQINPDSLGQDFMDLSVATKYCERLNRRSTNLKRGAIERLVSSYPSHDFVIDAEEAREIFERLEAPSPTLYGIVQKRPLDMMLPKTDRNSLVEMLTVEADLDEDEASKANSGESETGGGERAGVEGGEPSGETPAA